MAGRDCIPAVGRPTLFGTAVVVPGAARELRTFDIRTGKAGRTISLGSELAGLDLRMSEQGPIAATITGGLSAEWKLSFWEPLMAIPIAPLTVLPGKPMPLLPAPPPGAGP